MSKMLSSKHIFTILVTIVIAITYKPCESINNVNKVNKIKLSFLQKDAGNQDMPDSVKSGETVDVVSNKNVESGGNSKESSVESHTETKEVEKHDQDKTVGEPTKKEEEHAENTKKEEEQAENPKKEEAGHEEKKSMEDTEGSKSADEGEASRESTVEVGKETGGDQDSHVDAGTGDTKEVSNSDHDEHQDHEEQGEKHEADDSALLKDEGAKEEHGESEESENRQHSSGGSHKPAHEVESKQTEAEAHTHSEGEHKPEQTTDVTEDEGTTDHNEETREAQTANNPGIPESAPSKATPEQTEGSNDSNDSHEDKHTAETQQQDTQAVVETHPHQPVQKSGSTHVAEPSPAQPSTSTQNVVTGHTQQATDTGHEAPETGTSVAQQDRETQISTNAPTSPKPVELSSLTDDEKKKVVEFWKKASGDCSVDCSHACRSELQGATQCVSVSDSSLSCSTFGDSTTLTCPEGYTPCTQPTVSTLKSYTVKNNGVEVGALEVDGSNFSKCMGLALTRPDGKCDKASFVENLLFTAGALNPDYDINVAADKLTFSNLKIKNGEYRVCIFQRYEGNVEGMTISNILTRLFEFINPTSSTPKETKTVFVINVGTLTVSD